MARAADDTLFMGDDIYSDPCALDNTRAVGTARFGGYLAFTGRNLDETVFQATTSTDHLRGGNAGEVI